MEIKSHSVSVGGLNTYYHTAGDPKSQSLVFVHGWGARLSGRLGSDGVIAALAKYFYVVAPELPGFMRSEPPKEVWGTADFAVFLSTFLTPLNLDNLVLMGQSFGGGVVTEYAKRYPESIKALILVDATTSDRVENWYLKLRYIVSPLSLAFARSRFIPPILKRLLISAAQGVPFDMTRDLSLGGYEVMASIVGSPKYKVDVRYTDFSMPIMLVWGNKDTYITPIKRAREIHAQVPGSKLVVVHGPHAVLYRKPEDVTEAIVENLSELEVR